MINKILIALVIALTLYIGATTINNNPLGSVAISGEYHATTTVATSAGTHWLARTGSCTLGSVVVASSSATTLTLMNATSTTDIASTTITTLKAGISEGTYTYDTICTRGLVVETPADFNGSYTVTFR